MKKVTVLMSRVAASTRRVTETRVVIRIWAGIALLARRSGEVLERLLGGPGGLIGAHRGKRVVNVGHRDDARAERNMVADEPVRIARAVVLLVMTERDQRTHAHILRSAALEDLVPDHR